MHLLFLSLFWAVRIAVFHATTNRMCHVVETNNQRLFIVSRALSGAWQLRFGGPPAAACRLDGGGDGGAEAASSAAGWRAAN